VPEGVRGFVRDLRLRWACEDAGLVYTVGSIPFDDRETNHLAQQPFGQVPFLKDDELEIFESGAGLLHLARKSDKLMPRDPVGEAETLQWTIAGWMGKRLDQLERVLSEQEWLAAGRFTVAHLLMADVLRVAEVRAFGDRPATEAYVNRATDRGSFKKARADQIAHFKAADPKRAEQRSN
jgi:glutathione S-transferase